MLRRCYQRPTSTHLRPRRSLALGCAITVMLLDVGRVWASDYATEDLSPPESLARDRCWDENGHHLDLGGTYHIFHVEVGFRNREIISDGAQGKGEMGRQDDMDSEKPVMSLMLLNEQGGVVQPCHFQHGHGLQAQYACNAAGRVLVARGPASGRLGVCNVVVWGESVERAHRMQEHARELYARAQTWGSCTECKGQLGVLQACVRISRARAAGGDGYFRRWLAACTNDAGAIWLRKGEHDRALQMFRRALPLIDGHPIVVLNIAQVARKLCDWVAWHDEMTLVQQTVDAYNRRGIALMNPYMAETYGLSAAAILDMVSIISLQCFNAVHSPAALTPVSLLLPTLTPLYTRGPLNTNRTSSRRHVRVGYYSVTGLNAGRLSIGRFLQSVIALHGAEGGAERLEAVCFGEEENNDSSDIYQTLARGCAGGRVADMQPLSFADKARAVRASELDVFVDLSGFTHAPSFSPVNEAEGVRFSSSAHRLMALGVAPLHLSWWGYTGTLGAEFVHYVVTDVLASPVEMRALYAEKALFLPGTTYLVSDHIVSRQEVVLQHPAASVRPPPSGARGDAATPQAASPGPRRDAGNALSALLQGQEPDAVLLPALPPRIRARSASDPAAGVPSREEVLGTKGHVSVVLCSFNQFYKLNPDIWRLWMHVLRRTGPDSVLWMLEFDGDAVNNLVEEAIMMGVGTHRIVVSSLLPLSREFLSKGTCDLYLDTPLFNAHTTAKDALWSGVPVLTLAGEGMAARVAASLVLLLDPAAVTVARNLHDYQELAVRIAGNASALASLKRRVRQLRWTSPVFDTVGWMGRWERQLRNAADLVAAGYFPPAHMHLAGGSTRDVR